MIKKVTIIVLMTLFTAILGAETRVIPMPDLMKPEALFFDKTQMYVTEGTSIYIYSLKDFKLIKKFGKKGEGPQEFAISPQIRVGLILNVQTEDIIVNSFGKISWFTKDAKFKKELKLPYPFIFALQPFGKNFVGLKVAMVGQERWRFLNLYDDKLNELREIIKKPDAFQLGKGTRILELPPSMSIYDNKLFLAWEKDFVIKVVDTDINELYTIKRNEEKRKVTEEDKKTIINFIKTSPQTKDYFEILKPFHFPDYYPDMQFCVVTGNKIYAVTFKENETKDDECLIMDLKGKLLKRVFLPLKMSTPIIPHPYNIHEGVLYQVAENEEEEEWELHITRING